MHQQSFKLCFALNFHLVQYGLIYYVSLWNQSNNNILFLKKVRCAFQLNMVFVKLCGIYYSSSCRQLIVLIFVPRELFEVGSWSGALLWTADRWYLHLSLINDFSLQEQQNQKIEQLCWRSSMSPIPSTSSFCWAPEQEVWVWTFRQLILSLSLTVTGILIRLLTNHFLSFIYSMKNLLVLHIETDS